MCVWAGTSSCSAHFVPHHVFRPTILAASLLVLLLLLLLCLLLYSTRELAAGRPHAYVSCCKTLKLRQLLASTVAQLTQGRKRKRSHAFAAAIGTENSLIWELQGEP